MTSELKEAWKDWLDPFDRAALTLFGAAAAVLLSAAFLHFIAFPVLDLTLGFGSAAYAEQEAIEHATKLGWQVTGRSCGMSDENGIMGCTIVLADGSERYLECHSGYWKSRRRKGCRSTTANS